MSRDESGTRKDSHYARLRRAHRERVGGGPAASAPLPAPDGTVRLYGLHTVREAIGNPRRRIRNMKVTRNAAARLGLGDPAALAFPVEFCDPKTIDRICGSDAVHQGAVIEAEPLRPRALADLGATNLVLVLDQVTDPHNVGAILRSAVAFGAGALVTTARHSPGESGVLAKSASGALEHIDLIEVRNLADALQTLAASGFVTVGLDSEGREPLEAIGPARRIALVLGAEGKGLREKTRQTVGHLARLDLPGPIRSLNVSNAAAVALHVARSKLLAGSGL
jgi:23S rRNA (guanosine2251-2'-O)-methyltransferase